MDFIRKNPDEVQKALDNRGVEGVDLKRFLNLDSRRRDVLRLLETKRALRNSLSKAVAETSGSDRERIIEEATEVKKDVQDLETKFRKLDEEVMQLWVLIPNIPSDDMPLGEEEKDNVVIKVWTPEKGFLEGPFPYSQHNYMPKTEFPFKDHVDLGEELDLIDVRQSALVSGSRFYYLKNEAVLLQEAVFSLLKDRLLKKGYMPMIPPLLVKEKALFGTSHFPEGRDDIYKIESHNVEEQNELYLVGSSESSNFSYYMDKTIDVNDLPIKIYAETTCFRSEVGSWGKDVRGIKRVHQFDKVEMNAICNPDESRQIFDEFMENNEWMLQQLRLPYRIVNKCTGDAGYNASHLQYDFDFWRPGEREFMEGGTNTLTTDYQARRLNIKYRKDRETGYVHTVNDTGATTRIIIAILENYQQEDGSVIVPDILRPYMHGRDKIERKETF